MSLLSSASEWTTEDQPSSKRQSTIRNKTVKKTTHFANLEDVNKFNSDNVERNERVNKMINKITSLNKPKHQDYVDDDADNIPDFNPIITNYANDADVYGEVDNDTNGNTINTDFEKTNMNANTNVGINTLGYYNSINTQKENNNSSAGTGVVNSVIAPMSGNYSNSDADLYTLSNYARNYKPSETTKYYSSMGLGNGSGNGDNKLMERINYLIHMMEEQQYEKTNNITEEFILYVLLGVFTIFIVDSFSNIGKYTR